MQYDIINAQDRTGQGEYALVYTNYMEQQTCAKLTVQITSGFNAVVVVVVPPPLL